MLCVTSFNVIVFVFVCFLLPYIHPVNILVSQRHSSEILCLLIPAFLTIVVFGGLQSVGAPVYISLKVK